MDGNTVALDPQKQLRLARTAAVWIAAGYLFSIIFACSLATLSLDRIQEIVPPIVYNQTDKESVEVFFRIGLTAIGGSLLVPLVFTLLFIVCGAKIIRGWVIVTCVYGTIHFALVLYAAVRFSINAPSMVAFGFLAYLFYNAGYMLFTMLVVNHLRGLGSARCTLFRRKVIE